VAASAAAAPWSGGQVMVLLKAEALVCSITEEWLYQIRLKVQLPLP